MIKINGVAIATPSSFQVTISDIDGETSRNANGDLIRDRIAVKRKLELQWNHLSTSAISTILQAVQNVFFNVEYPDPMTGTLTTKNFYVGDRNAPMYNYTLDRWESLSMSFIER